MCGIHVLLSPGEGTISPGLECRLCNRGPDYLGRERRSVADAWSLTFTSTVLALRGDHVTKQPLIHPHNGSVLCWNGEAWRIDGRNVEGNDGEAILALLVKASALPDAGPQAILDVFRAVEGPFAFVYYDEPTRSLFYGRDRLGRRSLMRCDGGISGALALCSVAEACASSWKEVEADGIYVVDCSRPEESTGNISRHDWLAGGDADFVSSRACCSGRSSHQGRQPVELTVLGVGYRQVQWLSSLFQVSFGVLLLYCGRVEGAVARLSASPRPECPAASTS
jgi:hypothetical protein